MNIDLKDYEVFNDKDHSIRCNTCNQKTRLSMKMPSYWHTFHEVVVSNRDVTKFCKEHKINRSNYYRIMQGKAVVNNKAVPKKRPENINVTTYLKYDQLFVDYLNKHGVEIS